MELSFILAEIRKKNKVVFKKLFTDYYKALVLYANTMLNDIGNSEDVVQEVFIELWNSADEISIKSSIKGYLYGMVRNRCLNQLRSSKRMILSNWIEFNGLSLPEDTENLGNQEEFQELYLRIKDIMEGFPPQMYEVFRLRFVENCTYQQIAEQMGISVNTVKVYLKRAKEKIDQSQSSPPSGKKLHFF